MPDSVHEVHIPAGVVLDGAVVELGYVDGVLIADLRIPARQTAGTVTATGYIPATGATVSGTGAVTEATGRER